MPSKDASKKTAKGFAEILSAARVVGLTAPPPEPDAANAHKGALYYLALNDPIMLVPAKTPRPIVDRLYAETTKVLALPDVQQKLKVQGVEPAPMTPSEMDAMIRREIALNLKIAKEAGLKFN